MPNNSDDEPMRACVDIYTSSIAQELRVKVKIIGIIGLVSATLSFIFSTTVIGFIVWKRLFKNSQIWPLLHLSLADWMLSLLWIISTLKYFYVDQRHPESAAISCFGWQLLTEIIHLVTFFLTVNYSINVYFLMKDRIIQVHMVTASDEELPTSRFRIWLKIALYILSWCLPVILMMPIIINIKSKYISACQKCVILIDVPMLDSNNNVSWWYGYIILALTLTFSVLMIIVLYCLTLSHYWKVVPGFHTNRQRRQLANMQTRITLYIVAFIICWGPAIAISYHKWIKNKSFKDFHRLKDIQSHYGLYICQAICAPLQGFLNSIVYGWTRKSFRRVPASDSPQYSKYESFVTPYYDYDYASSNESSEEDINIETDLGRSPFGFGF